MNTIKWRNLTEITLDVKKLMGFFIRNKQRQAVVTLRSG